MSQSDVIILKGTCNDEFQSVKDLFESNLKTGKDENAQLCVYADGKCVVDLWGSSIGDEKFGPDDLQLVFSSGKNVAAFVVAMMVDRGLLEYEAKVSKYWPEFGQLGKEELTLADILRHEAGLAKFDEQQISISDIQTENIKGNALSKVIEQSQPNFANKYKLKDGSPSRRTYHSMSRGFILNELVRRVDPSGRTIGEILRQEVGIQGVRCGLSQEELNHVSPQRIPSISWFLYNNLFGNKGYMTFVEWLGFVFSLVFYILPQALFSKTKPLFKDDMREKKMDFYTWMSQDELRTGEAISFNSHATARGMAALAAMLADKGVPPTDGTHKNRLISEETWAKMHANPKKAPDSELFGTVTNFTQGGVAEFTASPGAPLIAHQRSGYVGWQGLGGSVFQWHPELKVGFAYVPSLLQTLDFYNTRGAYLQAQVKKCAEKLQKKR